MIWIRIIVKGVGIRTNRLHRIVLTTEKVQGAICQNVKDTRKKARQKMSDSTIIALMNYGMFFIVALSIGGAFLR